MCRFYDSCFFQALFSAHGPGFKRGYNTTEPLEAIEVYNLMAGKQTVSFFQFNLTNDREFALVSNTHVSHIRIW